MSGLIKKTYQSRPSVTGSKPDAYMADRKRLFSVLLALELGGAYGTGGGALTSDTRCLQAVLRRFGDGYCVL